MLIVLLSLALSMGVVLVGCSQRENPPLYKQRMEAQKTRFAKDDSLAQLTSKVKKERKQEREAMDKDVGKEAETLLSVMEKKDEPRKQPTDKETRKEETVKPLLAADKTKSEGIRRVKSEEPKTPKPMAKSMFVKQKSEEEKREKTKEDEKTASPMEKNVQSVVKKAGEETKKRKTDVVAKKDLEEGKKAAKSDIEPQVVADKKQLEFASSGGKQTVKLTNRSGGLLVIKTRCSDITIFEVEPVFSRVERGETVEVNIRRTKAAVKPDKVVFEWLPLAGEVQDLPAVFKDINNIETKLELQVLSM